MGSSSPALPFTPLPLRARGWLTSAADRLPSRRLHAGFIGGVLPAHRSGTAARLLSPGNNYRTRLGVGVRVDGSRPRHLLLAHPLLLPAPALLLPGPPSVASLSPSLRRRTPVLQSSDRHRHLAKHLRHSAATPRRNLGRNLRRHSAFSRPDACRASMKRAGDTRRATESQSTSYREPKHRKLP